MIDAVTMNVMDKLPVMIISTKKTATTDRPQLLNVSYRKAT